MRLQVILLTSLFAGNVIAGKFNVVIPFYTAHVNYDDVDRNNNNPGIGFEYKTDDSLIMGFTYLKRDSHGNKNGYFNVSYEFKNGFGVGGVFAPNYEVPLLAPFWSYRYKYIRIVSTLPFNAVLGGVTDVLNVKFVF